MSTPSVSPTIKLLDKLYINGSWVESSGTVMFDVINPTSEEIFARIPAGTVDDVNLAVAAAKAAFPSWSTTPASERAVLLGLVVEKLSARREEIANVIADEIGTPIAIATAVQAGLPIAVLNSFVKLLEDFQFEEQIGNSLIVREPVGVVGCITPWNYPLHQVIAKVGAALAAGCTVVLKPSEVAPLTAFILAETIHEAGIPAGVFNLVTGSGLVVGEELASHPDIDMISLTGSTRAGRQVSAAAAVTLKRVALELGGKSANIILDDADLARAVSNGVGNCFFNAGQTCSAQTRMLVPRSRYEEAVQIAKTAAEKYTPGDPRDNGVRLGPLASQSQRERVRDYIRKGIEEGATLVTGGTEAPEGLERGYFVRPTIFANVDNSMTIAQEEIFGPVLCIIPYEDDDDAVRIANDCIYGLAGGVWSGDPERAKRVARRLRTGQVDINGGKFNPVAPFGGYKQSGHGREFGKYGLEEFLEVKSLQL
ncbi:MAG: aldehyde dehydrogenase [Blastocatellia bacterium]|jgi:acyl-CoA reductase-like NAD-dependent aldehyde dehydrogenase|nr:aldehyde dehydrogenase [Blastocatellia bacterium]